MQARCLILIGTSTSPEGEPAPHLFGVGGGGGGLVYTLIIP